MQVNGVPNKYEIFQDFYYDVNGVKISYTDALRLFSQMDVDTKSEFEEYYKDETGYEIITSNGFNLDPEVGDPKVNGTKKKKKKVKQSDGSIKWVEKDVKNWKFTRTVTETNEDGTTTTRTVDYVSKVKKNNINTKYTLEAYAKENGLTLDPQWAVYSAEEIMQMYNDGVLIPQDIVDAANTIVQAQSSEVAANETEDDSDDTTEKEPFLDLIPKAEKKIKKCNENTEKIEDKVEDLLPEKQKKQKSFEKKMEEQKNSLKEYEDYVREWRSLQNKVNNGEPLSRSEAVRYAKLTGILEDKSPKDKGLDKMHIAAELNEINIIAALGEKLANETIEIGETLADYTSETNYKTTQTAVGGEIGFLRAIVAMANGKNLAEEAVKIGNETKTYTSDTQNSAKEIASIVGVEKMLDNGDEITEAPTAEVVQTEGEGDVSNVKNPATTDDTEEDFIVNDDNVLGLIDDAIKINTDLVKQTVSAVKSIRVAKDDRNFAKIAGEKVTKLVKEFQKREEDRQAEIQQKEDENKDANEELKSLTGKTAEELNEEDKTKKDDNQQEGVDKDKVDELKQKVASNNEDIENLKSQTEDDKDEFVMATLKEQEKITKAIPDETQALEKDTKYKEEIIPQDKKDLDFTDASGETLAKIGTYRIELGMMQIMVWNFIEGLKNIAKGTISTGIGLAAQLAGDVPTPTIAEKKTSKAVNQETSAINDLTTLQAQILSVTGEEDTTSTTPDTQGSNDNSNADDTVGEGDTTSTPQISTEQATAKPVAPQSTQASNGQGVQTSNSTSSQTAPKSASASMLAAYGAEKERIKDLAGENDATPTTSVKKSKDDNKEMSTDQANNNVSKAEKTGKEDGKDSEHVLKDTEKDEKQLEKETKKLVKQMKRDQKNIEKMTKESLKAAEKQSEILAEYEVLNAENEALVAEDEANKQSKPAGNNQSQDEQEGGLLATNGFAMGGQQSGNAEKLNENDQKITTLSAEFKVCESKITRNTTKIKKLQKSTRKNQKKFNKKTKIRETKIKEAEKKEQDKQKRLAKQLAAVGIANNVFSITMSTGTILMLSPWTHAVGQVMFNVGLKGTIFCAATTAVINLANGNVTAALMGLGTTAVQIASNFVPGAGAAASGVLGAVSAGLSVVSSSAELVNNVRAVQGKEANGVFSKIATIAGVASSVTSAASSLGSFGSMNTLGKAAAVAKVAGTALTSTSQLMSEFNWGDEKTANLLGSIGGGISLAASAVQLAQSFNKSDDADSSSDDSDKDDTKTGETKADDAKTEKAVDESATSEDVKADDKTQKQDNKTEKTENTDDKAKADAAQNPENNDVKNKFASPEYSDVTDEQLQTQLDEAVKAQDPDKVAALTKEQANRKIREQLAEDEAAQNAKIVKKQQKAEKVDKILDIVGQAAGATASVAGMFMTQKEGETKKKAATPGKLTKRAQDIIRKNAQLRKKRVQALAKSQRYYA